MTDFTMSWDTETLRFVDVAFLTSNHFKEHRGVEGHGIDVLYTKLFFRKAYTSCSLFPWCVLLERSRNLYRITENKTS